MATPLNLHLNLNWKRPVLRALRAASLCCGMAAAALVGGPVQAQSEASVALSLLPVASLVGVSSVGSEAAGAVVALPAALSVAGAVLTVTAVQASGAGTLYVLERASDGAQASVQVVARSAAASAHGVGAVVVCSVIGTGVLLSVAGEVLAFVPNAIGQALLHNERL